MINLDELRSRIEHYDRWRFVTTNGLTATYAVARDENLEWHVWYMHENMWLPVPPDEPLLTLRAALALIPNATDYYWGRDHARGSGW